MNQSGPNAQNVPQNAPPQGDLPQNPGTPAAPGTPGAYEAKIAELEAALKEKESRYLYLYADFENFKKRSIKERSELIRYAWEPQARELLQVLDNLERVAAHIPPQTDKNFVAGLEMVIQQFKQVLKSQGVEAVDSLNQPFDPNLHEAVAQEPSVQPPGTVIQEATKGYTLHGRLLRPARVLVSSGPATGTTTI